MVWIRFPGLNLYYYDESVLLALAAAVGKPIKVDSNTLDVRRGRFARVCVEIDLNKPVIGKVWLKGFWYKVEYEGLHRICSNCGCYGHLTRECRNGAPTTGTNNQAGSGNTTIVPVVATAGEGNTPNRQTGAIQGANPTAELEATAPKNSELEVMVTTSAENKEESPHGDWLIVQKKSRNTPKKSLASNGKKGKEKKSAGPSSSIQKAHIAPNLQQLHANKPAREQAEVEKQKSAAPTHLKNKRQRSNCDPPSVQVGSSSVQKNKPTQVIKHQTFNGGFGANNQLVSSNPFVFLQDNYVEGNNIIHNGELNQATNNQEKGITHVDDMVPERVPETQFNNTDMES